MAHVVDLLGFLRATLIGRSSIEEPTRVSTDASGKPMLQKPTAGKAGD
jgi:hypothetical protein